MGSSVSPLESWISLRSAALEGALCPPQEDPAGDPGELHSLSTSLACANSIAFEVAQIRRVKQRAEEHKREMEENREWVRGRDLG